MTNSLPLAGIMGLFDNPLMLLILAVVGILIFGKRLPEIGKNIGRSIVEFKKGLNSTGDEIKKAVHEGGDETPAIKAGPSQTKRIASNTDEP